MADRVEFDPEGFRAGTRAVGSAYEIAQASGSRLASALSGLSAALGKDKPDDLVPFADNIAAASAEQMPEALDGVHEAMRAGLAEFEAAEDSSTRGFA